MTTARHNKTLSLKSHCLTEQPPATSRSVTATQILNSKEKSPLPLEVGALDPFPALTVAGFVPQSQQSGCTEPSRWESSFASSSNGCYTEKKGKKRSIVASGRGMESSSGSLGKHRRAKPDKGSTEAAGKRLGRNTSRRIFKKLCPF